jgi:hypothetical protein
LKDGEYGNHVIQPRCRGKLPLEITAFIWRSIETGEPLELPEIERILQAKGCIQVYP